MLTGIGIRRLLAAVVLCAAAAAPVAKAQTAVRPASPSRAGADWWSLQPVTRPALPRLKQPDRVKNPIDAFLRAGLEARGLRPAPPADRRTLIRRACLDLLGLPPSPAEVEAFLNDRRSDAYERLIDRLLASPHYGERWARHWLDVARFAESHGYEYDHLRDNAWHYRDYVIRAFNSDKPYSRFLREQIAGDLLPDGRSDGVIATGFLVGGPMDEAGKAAAGLLVRLRAREEEMEDIVGLVGQTCLGLTVNCARCHNHKFDPITQKDYYRLKAALIGVSPGNRTILGAAEQRADEQQRSALQMRWEEIQKSVAKIEAPVRARLLRNRSVAAPKHLPAPYLKWTFDSGPRDAVKGLPAELIGGAEIANGRLRLKGPGAAMLTAPLPAEIKEKTLEAWVSLADLSQHGGSAITLENEGGGQFDGIVFGERQRGKWIAGSNNFTRTRDLDAPVETTEASQLVHMAAVYHADGRIQLYRNGAPYGAEYTPGPLPTYPRGASHLLFGRRHTGSDGYLVGEIAEAALYDRALTPEEVRACCSGAPHNIPEAELLAALSPAGRAERASLLVQAETIAARLRVADPMEQTYAAVSQQPEPTRILARGDVQSPGELVEPGGIGSLRGCSADFGLPSDSPDALRRMRLADWITDPRNPLTARVMVNRVWQYHFGHGIVGTPNDFGFNGDRPSNPALLDWLASAFQSEPSAFPYGMGGSLKRLHRLIMLSSAYRQSSLHNPAAARIDADDRLLWRFAPRRLEAEAVRDSMLAISGLLNPKRGGPSIRPFTVENFNSTFYKVTDPDSPEFQRRTIYQMIVHSARNPLLESLDCPDPSTKTPKRSSTTTPIQALDLMNDSFVLRQSKAFAQRVAAKAGRDRRAQITAAYGLAYGRAPSSAELQRDAAFLNNHGLDSFCWALFNSSEFLYVR